MTAAAPDAIVAAAEAAARRSYGRLVAFLASRSGDVAGAEDALADAFAAALATWGRNGIPQNPEAWLLTAARRKQIDSARRSKHGDLAVPHLELLAGELAGQTGSLEIPDRRLALLFACAHPALDPSIHTPLMLQTVLGLDAAAIGSAFLVSPAAMSQRLVRAKTKIKEARIPFRVPERAELPERLEAVLDVIYAAFTRGWANAKPLQVTDDSLTGEAIYLGRLLTELLPGEPEPLGLTALMLFAQSRAGARRDGEGRYVPLFEQDPELWDRQMIAEAETLLRRAADLARVGRYQLEAAVQSVYARRVVGDPLDFAAIVTLYDGLIALTGSPVAAINRAVALGHAETPAAGLAALEVLQPKEDLARYQPFWAARAELLVRCGRIEEADEAYGRAIGLAEDAASRAFLQAKRRVLRH